MNYIDYFDELNVIDCVCCAEYTGTGSGCLVT